MKLNDLTILLDVNTDLSLRRGDLDGDEVCYGGVLWCEELFGNAEVCAFKSIGLNQIRVALKDLPMLNDAEREYLTAVLRPMRNIVQSITHYVKFDDEEYIAIRTLAKDFALPCIDEEYMPFRGLLPNVEYTPSQLGL